MSNPARYTKEPVLHLDGVSKSYRQGTRSVEVLAEAELIVRPGELVALVGPSGSGKSTLLHIAGLLERPDSGTVTLAGLDCTRMADRERTRLRRQVLGFVYQYHHLLAEFSALENVMLPQLINGLGRGKAAYRTEDLLGMVGLEERLTHRPGQLSGGEQQRVAVARALANAPKILVADEPTGNLDPHTSEHVFEILRKLVKQAGLAALVATHNLDLARRMDRMLYLDEGRIRTDSQEPATASGS